MATFENMVLMRDPSRTFGFLSDLENVPSGTTRSSRPARSLRGRSAWGPPTSRSARFRLGAKNAWRSPPIALPGRLDVRGQLGPFRSRLFYALDTSPEGTRVTNTVEVELRGPGRLLGRLAVPRVREAVAANLRKLKELLEG